MLFDNMMKTEEPAEQNTAPVVTQPQAPVTTTMTTPYIDEPIEPYVPPKKKVGRPRKEDKEREERERKEREEAIIQQRVQQELRKREERQQMQIVNVTTSAPAVQQQQEQTSYVPICNSTDPYEATYTEGVNMIRGTIMQMDMLANEMKQEFDVIKNSRNLKGRYHYISSIGESIGSMLSSKLSAIKELNGVVTKCHELEMKRYQQNKELQKAEDDDHMIANMYNAYINTPINSGVVPPFLQQTAQNTIGNPAAMMNGIQVNPNGDIIDSGYNNYMNTITPEQNRMILEHNPNIKEVVVYDRATGGASFDVIDTTTNRSVPNYPRSNPELLSETTIDVMSGRATNSNLGKSWDVVTTDSDALSKF